MKIKFLLMKAKKTAAVVNFTIHSLRLPEDIQDPFQIEFKRGNTVGITEKKFVDTEKEVPFEKSFKCNITLIRSDDESTGEYRKKKIAFTVYRYRNNSKKVYGKFTINAADYLKLRTDTIEVENPHSKKAYVIMTVGVVQSDAVIAMNDLDSQSEAIQLQTDRVDEWDVSDMVTPESRERIQNFFMKREAEKNEQRNRLSDFTRVAVQKEARNSRSRYNRRGSIDLMNIQSSLPSTIADAAQQAETDIKSPSDNKAKKHYMSHSPSFNSNFMDNDIQTKLSTNNTESKEPVKLDNFLAKKNTKRGIPLPTINKEKTNEQTTSQHHSHHRHRSKHSRDTNPSSSQVSSFDTINDEDDNEYDNDANNSEVVKREISIENSSTLFPKILAKQWDKSPLNLSKYPSSASVIVAAFAYTHFLDNKLQLDDITKFIQMYKSSTLLSNLNDPIEKWYITAIIAVTSSKLKDQLNFDNKKLALLNSNLLSILEDQLYIVLDSSFRSFQQIGRTLIEGTYDDLEISQSLNSSVQDFQNYFTSKKLSKSIADFFTVEMVKYFDNFLVSSLIKTPDKCNFQCAIKWNTVMTVIYDSEIFRKNMNLFREAASALMMSSIICSDPQMRNEICPNLDVKIIYKILSLQKPDEFLPAPNDLTKFMEFYKLTPGNCEPIINLHNPQISFDVIYSNSFDVSEWKNVKFSSNIFDEFPFLKTFFSAG